MTDELDEARAQIAVLTEALTDLTNGMTGSALRRANEVLADLPAATAARIAQDAARLGALLAVEWVREDEDNFCCPSCWYPKSDDGHAADCALKAAQGGVA